MSTIQKCQLVDFDNNVIEEVRRAETAENSLILVDRQIKSI